MIAIRALGLITLNVIAKKRLSSLIISVSLGHTESHTADGWVTRRHEFVGLGPRDYGNEQSTSIDHQRFSRVYRRSLQRFIAIHSSGQPRWSRCRGR